jgi:hypothetical protein
MYVLSYNYVDKNSEKKVLEVNQNIIQKKAEFLEQKSLEPTL